MKLLCIACAIALMLAVFRFPIGYYTFLRILVSLGAGAVLIKETKNGINLLGITFIIILIVFNPIIPIYLYKKRLWMPIDIVTSFIFAFYAFKVVKKEELR